MTAIVKLSYSFSEQAPSEVLHPTC